MVYTLVLEANAEGIVSSSLTWRTKYGVEASMVMQWTVNPPPSGTPGSIPGYSTKFRKCGRVRFIAAVLKTAGPKGPVSSNLTVSAKFMSSWK